MEPTAGSSERQIPAASMEFPSLVAEENPPDYSSTMNPKESLLDAISAVVRTETICPHGKVNESSVEQLRNFLTFLLAVDYAPTSPSPQSPDGRWRLNNADLDHMVELADNLTRLAIVQRDAKCDDPELAEPSQEGLRLSAYYLEHLTWPAQALGLLQGYMIATMLRFFTLVSEYQQFTGSLRHILACYSVEGLASKLWCDRCVVVPRIVACTKLMKAVLEGIKEMQTHYFKELEGASMEISHRASSGRGWREVQWEKVELTDRAKRVEELTWRLFEKVDEKRAGFSDKNEQATAGKEQGTSVTDRILKVVERWEETGKQVHQQAAAQSGVDRRFPALGIRLRRWVRRLTLAGRSDT